MAITSSDIRICFVGDSFVNGTGDPMGLGWAGRICANAMQRGVQLTYYNLGIRRNTSADIASRWRNECERRLVMPDMDGRLIFSFGVNDTMIEDGKQRVATDETQANARRILEEAQARFPTLLVGPPPVSDPIQNERIKQLSAMLGEVAESCAIPYLSVVTALLASPIWMREVARVDGSHPQAEGYSTYAALVEQWPAWWFSELA